MYDFTTKVQLRCGKLCLRGGQFCGEVSGLQRKKAYRVGGMQSGTVVVLSYVVGG